MVGIPILTAGQFEAVRPATAPVFRITPLGPTHYIAAGGAVPVVSIAIKLPLHIFYNVFALVAPSPITRRVHRLLVARFDLAGACVESVYAGSMCRP